MPVVTMMVLWNDRDWNGPTSLFEMMNTDDPEILSMMNNYELKNIVIPARMTEEDFAKFTTDTGKILKLARDSRSKDTLMKTIYGGGYEAIDIPAADCISKILKMRLNICIEGDKANMCRAMDEINQEKKRERKQGRKEGRMQGKGEGLKQGIKIGIKNTFLALQSCDIAEPAAIERTAELYKVTPDEIRDTLIRLKVIFAR